MRICGNCKHRDDCREMRDWEDYCGEWEGEYGDERDDYEEMKDRMARWW